VACNVIGREHDNHVGRVTAGHDERLGGIFGNLGVFSARAKRVPPRWHVGDREPSVALSAATVIAAEGTAAPGLALTLGRQRHIARRCWRAVGIRHVTGDERRPDEQQIEVDVGDFCAETGRHRTCVGD
jgi:hypothetical protein